CPAKRIECLLLLGLALLLCLFLRLLVGFLLLTTTPYCASRCSGCCAGSRVTSNSSDRGSAGGSTSCTLCSSSLLGIRLLRRRRRSSGINSGLLLGRHVAGVFIVGLLFRSLIFLRVNKQSDSRSGRTRRCGRRLTRRWRRLLGCG